MTDKNQISKCPCCGSILHLDWGTPDFPGVENTVSTCTFCPVDVRDLEQTQRNLKIATEVLTWIANNHLADNQLHVWQLRSQARAALAKMHNNKGK